MSSSSSTPVEALGYPAFLERHRGLITADEVARLAASTVAIAGVGGVGGRLAEVLARSGVGHLRLADPDEFAESNLNRQAGSTLATVGDNKAKVVGELCASVSPIVEIATYDQGIAASTVDEFVAGADVVVDGTDYTLPSLGLMLARCSLSRGTPVVLGVEVAFGAWHTVLTREHDFERLLGLPATTTLADVNEGHVSVPLWRWIARVPPYVSLGALRHLKRGEIEAPAIAPAVELSAALLATDVLSLLLDRRPVVTAPRIHYFDAVTGKSSLFRPSKAQFLASLARHAVANRKH